MIKRISWEVQIGRRLRLRDLHAFCTVAQAGTMGAAARKLDVSQPAISKVIADLEHLIGVRLLDRSRKGVEPTIYGQMLLRHGLAAFDELKQSIRNIEFLADPAKGDLRIGSPASMSATFLPTIVQRFSEKYPRVALHVSDVQAPGSPVSAERGLYDRRHDLVLARLTNPLADPQSMDDVNVDYLFDDPLVVTTGKWNRLAAQRKLNLAELVNEPWILPAPGSWSYRTLAQAFQAQGLDMPKSCLVAYSVHIIGDFLARGSFVAALPRSWVHHNSFKVLPVELRAKPWRVAILTLKNRTLSPVVERFIECAREVVGSLTARRPGRQSPKLRTNGAA
jgi:DNA-binding transcriptional LysR family regulator